MQSITQNKERNDEEEQRKQQEPTLPLSQQPQQLPETICIPPTPPELDKTPELYLPYIQGWISTSIYPNALQLFPFLEDFICHCSQKSYLMSEGYENEERRTVAMPCHNKDYPMDYIKSMPSIYLTI